MPADQRLPRQVAIDLEAGEVVIDGTTRHSLATAEAFAAISHAWLRCGWDTKYVYGFSWLGRPVIQLPEDMVRMQEVIYTVQPDVIIETGIAHGGSLVYYASLCKAMGKGRVIGIDIDIRPHNRQAIEEHPLFPLITLIEGDSESDATIAEVRSHVRRDETAIVLLDSHHARDHVLAELEAYAPLVSPGSYIVAMDGIMESVVGAPRTNPDWGWNNPRHAALAFARAHPEFILQEPPRPFNEGAVTERVTYWPDGFLKRIR